VLQAPPVRTPERVCWVESCDRTAYHYGLCRAHHKTARRVFHGGEQRVGRASDSETRGEGAR